MKLTFATACLIMALTVPSQAGAIVDAAKKAEDLAAAGQHQDAIETLNGALNQLWQQSPLYVRKAVFVAVEPAGYGIYQPRANNTFKRTEPLLIYAEPIGYGFSSANGVHTIDVIMDFAVAKRPGDKVAEQKAFGNLTLNSLEQNREFFAKVTYDFSGLTAGDYDVTTTLTDKATSKSTSFTLPFTLTD